MDEFVLAILSLMGDMLVGLFQGKLNSIEILLWYMEIVTDLK